MNLTRIEQEMLNGSHGEPIAFCMQIQKHMGELYEADNFIPISQVHIDGCCYQTGWDAGLDFAEKLASMNAKTVVPATTNVTGRDIIRWRQFRQPHWISEKSSRMEKAYLSMGVIPTWTCAPYLVTPNPPRFGEQIVWAESNAIAYVNSVIGARTHRYGDFVDVCAAITGRTPYFGLHMAENRKGEIRVRLEDFAREKLASDASVYGALGYYLGKTIGNRIPIIEGVPADVTKDCLKALGAAGAASGALALFHIPGVTPEITANETNYSKRVVDSVRINPALLESVQSELTTAQTSQVDLVALGCPHFSYAELCELNNFLGNRHKKNSVECFIFTNQSTRGAAKESGLLDHIERSGIRVATDTCLLHWEIEKWGFKTMATNSGKFAKFAPGLLSIDVNYDSLSACAEAVISGRMPC